MYVVYEWAILKISSSKTYKNVLPSRLGVEKYMNEHLPQHL